MGRTLWLCCCLLGSAFACAAQQAPPNPPEPGPAARSPIQLIPRTREERDERYNRLHRILINVQVLDASGKPAKGLTQDNFQIFDNLRQEKIAAFRAINDGVSAKAHVLLVIDTLNNTARGLAYEHKEIERFLRSGPAALRYPISLVTLANGDAIVGNASRNADELSSELARATANVRPVNCLDDWNSAGFGAKGTLVASLDGSTQRRTDLAEGMGSCLSRKFQQSMRALFRIAVQEEDVPGRTFVIWAGLGWPRLTGPQFLPDTPHQRTSFFDNLVQLTTALREAQITLDAVSWLEPSQHDRLDKADLETLSRGTRTVVEAKAASLALPVLALQTGGRLYVHEKGLAGDLAQSLDDADAYYALSFDSEPAAAADQFHSIEVKTDRPELMVRATKLYYAEP